MLTSTLDSKSQEEGFIVDWVETIAKNVDTLILILANKPKQMPKAKNVTVYSLPPGNKFKKLFYLQQILLAEHKKSRLSGVFSHIYPFLAIPGAIIARLLAVKSVYWYAGGIAIPKFSQTHIALLLNDIIATCSHTEQVRYQKLVKNKSKIINIGHGISIKRFSTKRKRAKNITFSIGYAARCTPQKNIVNLVRAYNLLKTKKKLELQLALSSTKQNPTYFSIIKKEINLIKQKNKKVTIHSKISYTDMPKFYRSLDLYIHSSFMKSIDKAPLEAILCQTPVLLSSSGFAKILPPAFSSFLVDPTSVENIKTQISKSILALPTPDNLQIRLHKHIKIKYSLENLASQLTGLFNKINISKQSTQNSG